MAKKVPITRKKVVEDLWKSLVESAFDFFERAVKEHDKEPKYAVLHLAASIELFLKARLMAEHWTLIVSPKKTPTFDQLKAGDFLSVTPSEAIERLNGVLPSEESVSKEAEAEFTDLAKERNKIVHFFHPGIGNGKKTNSVIQRQFRVWLYLHRLLSNVWKSTFLPFASQLDTLDQTMREEQKYLTTIFDDAKPELDKHRKAGLHVFTCPACDFEALALQDTERYTNGQCHVCRYQNTLMRVQCPDCSNDVLIENGNDECPECEHSFEPSEVGDLIGGKSITDDSGQAWQSIYCTDCQTDDVFEINSRYVCLNCMDEWDGITCCDWCSAYQTGSREDTYWLGCIMCEGHAGYIRDKDD